MVAFYDTQEEIMEYPSHKEFIVVIDNEDGTYTVEKNHRSTVLNGTQLDTLLTNLNPQVKVHYTDIYSLV